MPSSWVQSMGSRSFVYFDIYYSTSVYPGQGKIVSIRLQSTGFTYGEFRRIPGHRLSPDVFLTRPMEL